MDQGLIGGTVIPIVALVGQLLLAALLVATARTIRPAHQDVHPAASPTPLAVALVIILPFALLAVRIPESANGPPTLAITLPVWLGATLVALLAALPVPAIPALPKRRGASNATRSPRKRAASSPRTLKPAIPAPPKRRGASNATRSPRKRAASSPRTLKPVFVALVAGILLLLLAASHDLERLTGQLFFAVAAVTLWLTSGSDHSTVDGDGSGRVAFAVTLALALGLVGTVTLPRFPVVSLAIDLVAVVVAGTFLVRRLPAPQRVTAACLIGGLGPILAIGILSVSRLVPDVVSLARGRQLATAHVVAHGFGRFALDGLLLVAVALVAMMRVGRQRTAIAGAVLGGAVLAVLLIRVTGLG